MNLAAHAPSRANASPVRRRTDSSRGELGPMAPLPSANLIIGRARPPDAPMRMDGPAVRPYPLCDRV
jgi:hypothetical protein